MESVKWLRESSSSGFASYPLYERVPFLERIRQAPEYTQFMAELKTRTDAYHREFSN